MLRPVCNLDIQNCGDRENTETVAAYLVESVGTLK